ncbi:MAG: DUF58 domain-containing protein [Solirubrobacteraceae bacterium MAG38_C4-C5]|nr:DUF58 domain-containing protein [Candidatus Siliceabacter maunaloa]
MSLATLRSLDLAVGTRVEDLWPGERRSPAVGAGTELAMVRPYEIGDDVRHLEPSATARTGQPHVAVHVAERALTTWLAVDGSASMRFGTADRRKADVAEGIALAVGHLATRRGNRLGVMTVGVADAGVRPPRQGRGGLLAALALARREPEADGSAGVSLALGLRRIGALARRPGLIVVVSDFREGPEGGAAGGTGGGVVPGWADALKRLAARHAVLAVEVRDPREQELPAVGAVDFVDPESGRTLRVDTSSRALRERFARAAARERAALAGTIRDTSADHLLVSTRGKWLRPLATFLGRRPLPARGQASSAPRAARRPPGRGGHGLRSSQPATWGDVT